MPYNYKLIIEYDGTGLAGWQKQPDKPSVQQHIENAVYSMTSQKVPVHGAGRTDAGVHALGMVANFQLEKKVPEFTLLRGLNHYLKKEANIVILSVEGVDEDFHARFSAKSRSYEYKILNRRSPPALLKNKVTHIPVDLDFDSMKEATKYFLGEHNFTSFRASSCGSKTPVKNISNINLSKDGDIIALQIEGNSFLHHMVRNIAGTLIEVGKGERVAKDIPDIIKAKDRKQAGQTAKADGLYFVRVEY